MLTLSKNGLIRELWRVEDEDLTALASEQVEATESVLGDLRDELRTIEASRELTREGKEKARAALVEARMDGLRGVLGLDEIERLGKRIEGMERSLFERSPRLDPPEDTDPAEFQAQVQETRRLLRQKLNEERGAIDVQLIALEAARNDDVVTLTAIEKAPPAFPLLSGDTLRLVQEAHAETKYPTHVQKLREMRSGLTHMKENAKTARRRIQELTGTDPVDSPELWIVRPNRELEPWDPDAEPEPEPEPEPAPEGWPEPDPESAPAA